MYLAVNRHYADGGDTDDAIVVGVAPSTGDYTEEVDLIESGEIIGTIYERDKYYALGSVITVPENDKDYYIGTFTIATIKAKIPADVYVTSTETPIIDASDETDTFNGVFPLLLTEPIGSSEEPVLWGFGPGEEEDVYNLKRRFINPTTLVKSSSTSDDTVTGLTIESTRSPLHVYSDQVHAIVTVKGETNELAIHTFTAAADAAVADPQSVVILTAPDADTKYIAVDLWIQDGKAMVAFVKYNDDDTETWNFLVQGIMISDGSKVYTSAEDLNSGTTIAGTPAGEDAVRNKINCGIKSSNTALCIFRNSNALKKVDVPLDNADPDLSTSIASMANVPSEAGKEYLPIMVLPGPDSDNIIVFEIVENEEHVVDYWVKVAGATEGFKVLGDNMMLEGPRLADAGYHNGELYIVVTFLDEGAIDEGMIYYFNPTTRESIRSTTLVTFGAVYFGTMAGDSYYVVLADPPSEADNGMDLYLGELKLGESEGGYFGSIKTTMTSICAALAIFLTMF